MRKYGNALAIGAIALLLFFGYTIPSIALSIEDHQLESEEKSIEIEEIELNVHDVDVMEELGFFSDMLLNNIIVEQEEIKIMETMSTSDEKYQRIEAGMINFLQIINPDTEFEFEEISATYSFMMFSKKGEVIYPVWKCYGIGKDDKEYCFWMDDLSGKVMAFDIPYDVVGLKNEDFIYVMEQIGNYYDYTKYALSENSSEFYKEKEWQNEFMLCDEDGNIDVSLNVFKIDNRLMFNVYPGTGNISEVYDVE